MLAETQEFTAALAAGIGAEERLILCGFPGDPNAVGPTAWRPHPWAPGHDWPFNPQDNAYATVASFGRAPDRTFRRRTETFRSGLALMVDDVGTKVAAATVAGIPASAVVETSPGNQQHWYFFAEPERSAAKFDALIRAFIAGRLLGADPGMSGITRVGRVPGTINGKAAYKREGRAARVSLVELNDRRWTPDELVRAFGLTLNGTRAPRPRILMEEYRERNRAFLGHIEFLRRRGMLKRDEPDLSGWTEMHCPWVNDHTAGADTGAAIREPNAENGFWGAFRCHHGHCAGKGWPDLTDWIADQAADELNDAAELASAHFLEQDQ